MFESNFANSVKTAEGTTSTAQKGYEPRTAHITEQIVKADEIHPAIGAGRSKRRSSAPAMDQKSLLGVATLNVAQVGRISANIAQSTDVHRRETSRLN